MIKILRALSIGLFMGFTEIGEAQARIIRPGDTSLQTAHLTERSRDLLFQALVSSGDSVTMNARVHRGEHIVGGAAHPEILLEYGYEPPINTSDSLVVDPSSLAPRIETLRLAGRTIDLAYTPTTVDIEIRSDTGSAVHHARQLATPAFAFNEREVVIRSLPLREGFEAILPLFSELDETVEMDSVSVIGHGDSSSGRPSWRVRFADPAIVVMYEIDEVSRVTLSESVVQRQGGRRMRYVPASPARAGM